MISFKQIIVVLTVVLAVAAGNTSVTAADYAVIDGEYKLAAAVDASVTTATKTELWAHVWRPATEGTYPLVVFLHGNHATCGRFDPTLGVRVDDRVDYTTTGKCPYGYTAVPSHLGYAYLAKTSCGLRLRGRFDQRQPRRQLCGRGRR